MFAHSRGLGASRRREERPAPRIAVARWLTAAAVIAISHAAHAHGIVGNRIFPGTLAFDDPAVMDELILPAVSRFKHPGDGADAADDRIGGSFSRLLTSTLAFEIESGWVHRNWGSAQRWGFESTSVGLKALLYKNDLHEMMLSAGLALGIRGSGARGIGESGPDSLQPAIFFGKGFGDLPDSLSWLRPFAVTGAVTLEHPFAGTSTNFGVDGQDGQLGPTLTRNVDILHWGFSIRYSTFYLTDRPGKLPQAEP